MPKYTIKYFESRGRAENSRMALVLGGQEFNDVRYSREQWQEHKDKTPQNQLPLLEVDGMQIPQSGAMVRHLGRELGLYGASNQEAATIDVVLETESEMLSRTLLKIFMEQDPEKKVEIAKEVYSTAVPKYLKIFADILANNKSKSGWLVGDKPSVADIVIYNMLCAVPLMAEMVKVDSTPIPQGLQDFQQKFASIPSIKKWIETRPKTQF